MKEMGVTHILATSAVGSLKEDYRPGDLVLADQFIDRMAMRQGIKFHEKGTCVVLEGPRFSTRAESNIFRSWGADIIGMTMVLEAVLAREAESATRRLQLLRTMTAGKPTTP